MAVERKFDKDASVKKMYNEFMQEYERLGHMEEVPYPNAEKLNYLPHHSVLKLSSTSTKCRVVFDASAPTTSGVALNDLMPPGPTIQRTLFLVLLSFRYHKIALCGDIQKMYRQIWVHPDDQRLQCILWRRDGDRKLRSFKLKTVTYGTSSAPYLAIRTLNELARSVLDHPEATRVLTEDTYVDDSLTGGRTVEKVTRIYHLITSLIVRRYGDAKMLQQ